MAKRNIGWGKRRYVIVAVVVVGMTGGVFLALGVIGWDKMRSRYGDAPLLFFGIDEDRCLRVGKVVPPTHFNFLGQAWQEPSMTWEDVAYRVDHVARSHGLTGKIAVGDRLCSVPLSAEIEFEHVPTESIIASFRNNP